MNFSQLTSSALEAFIGGEAQLHGDFPELAEVSKKTRIPPDTLIQMAVIAIKESFDQHGQISLPLRITPANAEECPQKEIRITPPPDRKRNSA